MFLLKRIWRVRAPLLQFTALCVAVLLLFPTSSLAQLEGAQKKAQLTTEAAGVTGGTDLITIIGRIINIALGFVGVVFLILMLYAGYQWMTSEGDPEKVKKAQQTIRNAIIGLVIIASAWAITAFILNALIDATGGGGDITSKGVRTVVSLPASAGSLGAGIIEMHLPERNASNVPRNTSVMVTFKEPIDPASFIDGWTEAESSSKIGINAEKIKIFRTDGGEKAALPTDTIRVRYTKDFKTFVLKPVGLLGSPSVKVGYSVIFKGGKSGVLKKDKAPAFGGSFGSGYQWQFEVSTIVDRTPPTLISAVPLAGGSYARNALVQMTFSRPIDPTSASGKTTEFQNIDIAASDPGGKDTLLVSGEFKISNQYRTVEFLTDVKCGVNSCGRDVWCLPGKKTFQVKVKAATIDLADPPQAQLTSSGYDGIVDLVGNSFDGNQNGKGEGPPSDNTAWTFATTDDLKLSPPRIESTMPDSDPRTGKNSNVPLDQPVRVNVDSLLQSSSLITDNARIEPSGPGEKTPDSFWWTVGMKLLTTSGSDYDPKKLPPDAATKAALILFHRPYLPSGIGRAKLNFYIPRISSGIQDAYQNCLNPASKCGIGEGGPNCCNSKPKAGECAFSP